MPEQQIMIMSLDLNRKNERKIVMDIINLNRERGETIKNVEVIFFPLSYAFVLRSKMFI